ncbi:ABC-F family ATP-binding cassette domain-containing protein [Alicyclobacillus sp. SO9]|uniref:ABC-F family ATP-binding cassette domain-containing protein n=1 Tax=Alicyclobacillus sp. SO9 TaxID=2665646 RepID=UPI0018E8ED0D|nr:ABC-F family ATP-binding cassette domain-containing protein [Alicyclobacillus sp. SO9]QQE78600.1 ABC-F family ATP-binding cassette domain-containing protein [Alicyclobacillus sp. SO9]
MILLQASHIEKQYDGHVVLTDGNIVVQDKERIALLGQNGTGKSTMLRIIVGEEQPDKGTVSVQRSTGIGYVAQFVEADNDLSVYEFTAQTFETIIKMEKQLNDLELQMANPDVYSNTQRFEQIAASYDKLRQQFTDADGYAVEAKVRRVLKGLGFASEIWNSGVKSLSGGQKTRLSLAKLLAQEPDLLILDEPTNYLDTKTLVWLESYLKTYEGAILLVSHDRYFLDAIATGVYELRDGKTQRFNGNYTDYVEQKAEIVELETKHFEAQQQKIAKMEEFVQKNLVRASTTKRAQSRRKMLEKMERLEKPDASVDKLALHFASHRTSGRDVLSVENLSAGYNGIALGNPVNLLVRRGDRLAIVGPNGIGKTTLLKTLVGRQVPVSGHVRWGTKVDLGYYEQEQETLDASKTVLEQIYDEFPQLNLTTVRTALGRFLFRGEDVEKPVSALSGGERSRVALCRLMLSQPNVLVMDEPTNHLDLLAKEVLEDALSEYDGTLIFVSHDRYFMDALATHVLHIDEDGIKLYLGNYTEYIHKRQDEEQWDSDTNDKGTSRTESTQSFAESDSTAKSQRGVLHVDNTSVRSADLRKARETVEILERKISEVEQSLADVSGQLVTASMSADVDSLQQFQQQLSSLEQQHEELLTAWEQGAEELERLTELDRQNRRQK